MFEVKNKVVLVTGGAVGLGSLIATEFLDEGAKFVALLDINREKGEETAQILNAKYGSDKAEFIKCDVTNTNDLDDAYKKVLNKYGYIDVVVNNAGIIKENEDMYLKEIAVNFTAVITNSLKAYNLMRKDRGGKGGTVVNISSVAAFVNTYLFPIYNATKAGVLKFSITMGAQTYYAKSDVRFICLCYGPTDTAILRDCVAMDEEVQRNLAGEIKKYSLQCPVKTAKSTMQVFKNGVSGSVWLITNNKQPKNITRVFDNLENVILSDTE